MKPVVKLYVYPRRLLGATSKAHREMIAHPICAPDQYSQTLSSIGNGLLKSGLSTEEQSVLARLEPHVENGEIEVTIHDLSKFFSRFKARLRHGTTKTPFLVVGSKVLHGKVSRDELAETISLAAVDSGSSLKEEISASTKKPVDQHG